MNIKASFIIILLLFQWAAIDASSQAVLVHNTMEEINACEGKLHLKLIRVWGGDKEADENKFFITPVSIAIDRNKLVYISDTHGQCIKVFDFTGKYLRTVGRKGRGPGDVYGPGCIDISTAGDLLVDETGGRRIQWFSTGGESKGIIKSNRNRWIAVTSKDDIVTYSPYNTFLSKKLLTVYDRNGKTLRQIGQYHDKAKSFMQSEKLKFSIDDSDNIYAVNVRTPVIRKYSPEGKFMMAITLETPFDIPAEISLNPAGNEIERKEEGGDQEGAIIKRSRYGLSIHGKGKGKETLFSGIGLDSQGMIYIVISKRILTEKEKFACAISWGADTINRERVNFDIVENIDCNRLLVFNPEGKVAAEAAMTTFCDGIYIKNKRIYIIDGFLNQRILEYEMSFKK